MLTYARTQGKSIPLSENMNEVHRLIKELDLSYAQEKCKDGNFRIFNKGWKTFEEALFTGKYDETLEFLLNYNISEDTVAADLGSAPEKPVFKGPNRRKEKSKKLRKFKEIALDTPTDTFIKEKK